MAVRIFVAAFVSLFGLLLVLTIDRSVVFAMDIRKDDNGVRLYVILRMLMVLSMGLFTSEQVIPFMMKPDLVVQSSERSIKLRSQAADADKTRSNVDGRKHIYDETKRSEDTKSTALDLARRQLNGRIATYNACRRRPSDIKKTCRSQRSAVAEARQSQDAAKAELDTASNAVQQAFGALESANDELERRQRESDKDQADTDKFRAVSMGELFTLISNDWEARIRFGVILFIFMMIETMPLLTKTMVGRTNVGHRLSTDETIQFATIFEKQAKARSDLKVAQAVSELHLEVFQLEEIRRRAIDELQNDILPYLKAHVTIKIYDDMIQRLKATIRSEFSDTFDYRDDGSLLRNMYARFLDGIGRFWK